MIYLKHKVIPTLIFAVSFLVINSKLAKRTLNYQYEDGIKIPIEETEDSFQIIIIEESLQPYELPFIGWEDVYKDEIKNLAYVFDEIFKDSEESFISVNNRELTESQNEIILNIFKRHKIIYELKYEILNNVDYYDKTYTNRGYRLYYDEDVEGVLLTIAMGERPTGGYSINIRKIKIKESSVTIYVTEKAPFEGEIVTEAITYPIISLRFNTVPHIEEIINSDTDETYPKYKYQEN